MDINNFQKIRELIEKNDKIAIAVGRDPSVDNMAAALSLSLALTQINKRVSVVSPTEPLVEHSSLIGINNVKGTYTDSGGDLVVSFPYKEGEIEKVSYTIESGFLNIVVKAGQNGLTFEEQDVIFKRGGGQLGLLIVIGAQRLSDLGELFDQEALKNAAIINIDNNDRNEGYGDVVQISPKSISEQVASLLQELNIDLDIDVAQNILNGIASGTDNFQSPSTDYSTFELAGALMRKGAIRNVRVQPRAQDTEALQSLVQRPNQMQRPNLTRPALSRPTQSPMQRPMPPRVQAQPAQSFQRRDPQEDLQQKRSQIQDMLRREQQNQQQPAQAPDAAKKDPNPGSKPPSDWLTPKVYKGSSDLNN